MIHLGTIPASTTIYVPFTTYAGSTGASVTCSGLAVTDVEIYKNGSTTQRSSDAGISLLDTDGIDFDGITGLHGFSIDLSDNTDAGFYAVGSFYWVVVSAITVDSQTVTFLAATFRIGPAESITGYPKADLHGLAGSASAAAALAAFWDGQETGTAQAGGDSTITLRSGASATDDLFELSAVAILSGTGAGQVRKISAGGYNGTTKVATVTTAWTTQPDSTSVYMILGRIE